jgi:four helix bundle protein
MDSHRNLVAWQRGMSLATEVYRVVESFPGKETYGLVAQVCKAAVSVPSNIAEGKGRLSKREYIQFLSRARGSLLEVETQLEIARNVGYLSAADFEMLFEQAAAVGRPLNGLIKSVRDQLPTPKFARPRAKSQEPRAKKHWTTENY